MSAVEPWRMPHWLTPVCDDQPVSHPTRWWVPVRSQRCNVGTSPERRARSSTTLATPSSWTNTTPGTSVTVASPLRRRARRDLRGSNHESSSRASARDTSVVTAARPTTTATDVQKPVQLDAGQLVEQPADQERVDDDRPQAEREHRDRDDDDRQRRPDERVQHADDEPGGEGVPAPSMEKPSSSHAEQPERERGGHDDEQGAAERPRPRRPLAAGRTTARAVTVGGHVGLPRSAGTGTSSRSDGSSEAQAVAVRRRRQLHGEPLGRPVEPGRARRRR